MMATPIGWFAAGIGAVGGAIWAASKAVDYVQQNWPAVWRTVSNIVGGVVDTFGALFDILTLDYFDNLTERIDRMAQAAADLVPDWLKNWLGSDGDKEVTVRHEQARQRRERLAGGMQGMYQQEGGMYWSRGGQSKVKVEFANAPAGTRVTQEGDGDAEVDLSMGFPMRGN
jgi:hypothetical protein